MRKFFAFIIRQSVAVILLTLLILGTGVWSAVKMPVNLLPDINIPVVCVQTVYAGANASTVEKDVTEKVEDGLSSLGGVNDVISYSYDNLSAVVLYFDYGTDTNGIKTEIQNKLASVDLPDGVSSTVYDVDLNAEALASLSVTSEKGSDDAYEKAKELSAKFAAIDGVESVEIKGGAEEYYLIQPFGGLELIAPLIVEAFSYGALDLPLGTVTEDGGNVQIKNESDVQSEDDIYDTPVILPEGIVTLLREIRQGIEKEAGYTIAPSLAGVICGNPSLMARIRAGLAADERTANLNISDGLVEFILKTEFPDGGTLTVKVGDIANVKKDRAYSSYAYYFGGVQIAKGVVVNIYKSNGANSSKVVKRVKSVCASFEEEGVSAEINLLDDQSEFISDSVSNVLISMLIGGVLAVLIIFVFLKKVRTSLVVAITMPLSVLAALVCLYLLGVTLNMVSLGGLAVGIGMLVDNSIVVIEAITKHRDGGKDAYNAAVDGTCEVGGALFGSTVTTVCVFIPIIFAGGLTAEIFTDLSLAVIFSLAFSLIVAVTVIPALYTLFCGGRRLLKDGSPRRKIPVTDVDESVQNAPQAEPVPEKKTVRQKLAVLKKPVVMDGCTKLYSKILPKVLSRKLVTILVAVVVFGSSIGLLFLTGTEFLPSISKGEIEVTMSYAGESLDEVQSDVLGFSQKISEEIDGIDYLSASIGKNGLLALSDSGIITVKLKSNSDVQKTVNAIRALANEVKPLGSVAVKEIDGVVASLMSGSDDMSVTVVGNDGETLVEIAEKIGARLTAAGFTDVKNSASEKSLQYTLNFDKTKLADFGIDYKTLILTLRIGIASYTACTVNIGGANFDINVKFADGAIDSRESLESFVVGFNGDSPVLLSEVCTVTEEEKDAVIRRSNGNNMISVSAVLPDSDTGTASKKLAKIAGEVVSEYDGYGFEASGITTYLNDAFSGLAVALVISFFLLYAVMAIQFSSFLKPLIIMASIPFSFTGGFVALVICGCSLNVVSFIGLIMLMGVVVNNAIVMLEKIRQLKAEMPHFEAVKAACASRLRPIFMTTLTTILALIPMAIGVGQGSELMQPLGIVVIGGLLIGTLVTLLLVPAVYCAVHRLSSKSPEDRRKTDKNAA